MKTLRLLFTSLTFCLFIMSQSNAQVIVNNTTCSFEVKENTIPTGTCGLTGMGALHISNPGTTLGVILPGPAGSHWAVAYGVRRPGIPVKLPGDPVCGFGLSYFVGMCSGALAFATYDPATQNLDIHF